ncbi:MAG: zinc ribbon domain-containing protein [Lachnospiraceae bacterium]|nr:zinc ribbon domain-containing protein [Lachnospiraceae bacterium]
MKIKCDFCGSMIDETEKACPNCGAPLSGANRTAPTSPQTIEELRQWYIARNLPPEEVTRFFIGKDIKEPKAFGIYKNSSGDFVVYKNKSDGSRAVRYQGSDEAYAVNELYQRMRSQIEDQKRRNNMRRRNYGLNQNVNNNGPSFWKKYKWAIIIIVGIVIYALLTRSGSAIPSGYYNYGGRDYYYQDSDWYYYDNNSNGWFESDSSSDIYSNITGDNYSSYSNNYSDYSFSGSNTFESSDFYDSDSGSSWYDSDDDSSWDSDWSWDSSDSWDSDWGGGDWDSDW